MNRLQIVSVIVLVQSTLSIFGQSELNLINKKTRKSVTINTERIIGINDIEGHLLHISDSSFIFAIKIGKTRKDTVISIKPKDVFEISCYRTKNIKRCTSLRNRKQNYFVHYGLVSLMVLSIADGSFHVLPSNVDGAILAGAFVTWLTYGIIAHGLPVHTYDMVRRWEIRK